jgi:hypothetical protein
MTADVVNLEVERLREDLAIALSCGRTCEDARRKDFHAFEVLQRAVTLAINAPNAAARFAYLRQAAKHLDEIITIGFAPMSWPDEDAKHG